MDHSTGMTESKPLRAGARLKELEQLLEETYGRWEKLETMREEYLNK